MATVDHLSPHHRVTVLRDFTDARGARHRAGERGVITRIGLGLATGEFTIVWERNGREETMRFPIRNAAGPGSGTMRQYFALGEFVPPQRAPGPADSGATSVSAPVHGDTVADEITAAAGYPADLARVVSLAKDGAYAEARALLRTLDESPDRIARDLGAAAERYARDDDGRLYEWLRDRAVEHWYAWGSGATSGGDGAARLLDINPAMERFRRLDAERRRP